MLFHKPQATPAAISIPFAKLPTQAMVWSPGGLAEEPLRVPHTFLRGRMTAKALGWFRDHRPDVYHRWLLPWGITNCWFRDGGPRWCILFDRIKAEWSQEFDRQVDTDAALVVVDSDLDLETLKSQVTQMLHEHIPDPAYYVQRFGVAHGRREFVADYCRQMQHVDSQRQRKLFVEDVDEELRAQASEAEQNRGLQMALELQASEHWDASATERLNDLPGRVCACARFYRSCCSRYGRLEKCDHEEGGHVFDAHNWFIYRQDIYRTRPVDGCSPAYIGGITYLEVRRSLCNGGACPYVQGRYLYGPEERQFMVEQLRSLQEDLTAWGQSFPSQIIDDVVDSVMRSPRFIARDLKEIPWPRNVSS
jgi:hypothetical protein